MPNYQLELKRSAQKELEQLPSLLIGRIVAKLEALQNEPRPKDAKKLKGGDREYRVRMGDYRVIYVVDDGKRLVSVTRVRHRREAYQ